MKRLDELGVSPAPWDVLERRGRNRPQVVFGGSKGETFAAEVFGTASMNNCRLIAAAPDLYEALREAVIEACHDCDACGKPGYRKCRKADGECFVQDWRKALEKAGGAK